MVGEEKAEIETIDENMPVLEDCDLDNSGAIEYVEAEIEPIDENMPGLEDCDLDNTIIPALIFVSGKVFLEIEVVDADRGAVEYVARSDEDTLFTMALDTLVIEDCDLDNFFLSAKVFLEDVDNTIFPAVIFVSDKVDSDRGTIEYVGRSLHKVITHLRIIAFESRRTHT
jgi:hypothetical protein